VETQGPDPADEFAARQADLLFRQSATSLLDKVGSEDAGPGSWNRAMADLAGLRVRTAEALSAGARLRFDHLSQPAMAGFTAEGAARSGAALSRSAAALSLQRQDHALAEFQRLIPLDPERARLSLASALAEQDGRGAAAGLGPEARRAEGRALLSRAHHQSVLGLTALDPDQAATMLQATGPLLPDTVREALATGIQAEQVRRDARDRLADLGRADPALLQRPEALTRLALQAAGSDPARQSAFRAAAASAHRQARTALESTEDQTWAAAAEHLARGAGWTDLPGDLWAALTSRQQAAFQAWSERPYAPSDPAVLARLEALASGDLEGFRSEDLGAQFARLTPADYADWRQMQQQARLDSPAWRQVRNRATRGERPDQPPGSEPPAPPPR
jgi:hypothetical protein